MIENRLVSVVSSPALPNIPRFISKQCGDFGDFENDFDSVNTKCIWNVLLMLTTIVRVTYDDAKYRILHRGKISKEIQGGARRDCILSLVLFLLVICDFLNTAFSGEHGGIGSLGSVDGDTELDVTRLINRGYTNVKLGLFGANISCPSRTW